MRYMDVSTAAKEKAVNGISDLQNKQAVVLSSRLSLSCNYKDHDILSLA